MNRALLILLFWLPTLPALAAQWSQGHWQASVDGDIIDIQIVTTSSSAIQVKLDNLSQDDDDLTAQTFRFTDDSQTIARTDGSPYMQIRRTTFGEFIFQRIDDTQKDNNALAFLKPVKSGITTLEDYPTEQAIADLPEESVWLDYANQDLWKFWGTDTALEFSSSRCNDGELPDITDLCRELRAPWIAEGLPNNYTRMLSRQVYAYGVLFNVTGNKQAYAAMQKGLTELLSRFEDTGSVATILREGKAVYRPAQRTSQDLAYAQVGLAMAFYLTGDAALLDKIELLKNHIVTQYVNKEKTMLAWTLEDQMPGDAKNQELVAQLDQLNAYMLLVFPHLPDAMQKEWAADIRFIVEAMLDKFHIEDRNRFAGQLVNGEFNDPGERHNDFGHSVKTYWMIYIAGQLLDDERYQRIGTDGIEKIIQQAIRFREHPQGYSQWGNQIQSNSSSWWEFAELTQATATLALDNPDYSRYLPDVYQMWLNNFVDKKYGGVWMSANGGAKQHLWKNGYHETEFGLVALIASQRLKQQPIRLYFARTEGHFQPYLFNLQPSRIHIQNDLTVVTF
ncbi:hypothetical protein [Reinekea sp. G2M2-21]|uniref:hypothetical protein n=1 Tax=Reinekea sp. G2M2-21 TaxID=2788942 RepID=UPI0018ABB614|nr:hypothetical protein [Reinekea sp. G2M2-21]